MTRPRHAETIWPSTVAMAAPLTPMAGKPSRPKIKIGSMMMLMTAPVICVIMESEVRPVACKNRSKQNWKKMPNEQPTQMVQ